MTKNKITLSQLESFLMKAADIIHELTHLLEPNHTPRGLEYRLRPGTAMGKRKGVVPRAR